MFEPKLSVHCMVNGEMIEKVHRTKVLTYRQKTPILITSTAIFKKHRGKWEPYLPMYIDNKYNYWNALFESTVNEHAPVRRKRVREKELPYMTSTWKKAIRNKRKYAIQFAKNRTPENMELKRTYRNIATRERRKAIMEYWFTKSEDNFRQNNDSSTLYGNILHFFCSQKNLACE